MEVRGQK